ncbi:catechol 2,3-dioxygenase [Microbacterium phyllosphaerae]|uniref:Catechol 2,3-dioxygenase n=1 Tax=Microbacterium phyllosphaerae TaxID=124798 RepID=A0ABS4WSR4_9MICO|nr:VOC family protein [Microbacterium phyllosphaerae]MBP2379257.1 catechol 2,3-dioxygenase [Microbacterium phyllosphaerae]
MTATIDAWRAPAVSTTGAAPDGARMNAVELLVRDLDTMTAYYQEAVTLDILDQSGATATLGRAGEPIMRLRQEKDLPTADPRAAGLYHTAILFQDESRLAAALLSVAQRAPQTFTGSADHLVSEAFYFTDPEGNGLELYHDRPREHWQVAPDGSVHMDSLALDPNQFLRQWLAPDADGDGQTATIGHVHLQVGDIPTARRFYSDILGFDVTAALGNSALFVSAGGYHHHIGMNTWQSAGAGPRAASLGLGDVRVTVPTRSDIEELADRLSFHGIDSEDDGRTLRLSDPWGTRLALTPDN